MGYSLTFRCAPLALLVIVAPAVAGDLPKVRHLRIEFKCEVGDIPDGAKIVDLWIPIPPSNERQKVQWLNQNQLTTGRVTQDKTFGNQLYYQRFDAADTRSPIKVELIYDVEVHEATVEAATQLISTSA